MVRQTPYKQPHPDEMTKTVTFFLWRLETIGYCAANNQHRIRSWENPIAAFVRIMAKMLNRRLAEREANSDYDLKLENRQAVNDSLHVHAEY